MSRNLSFSLLGIETPLQYLMAWQKVVEIYLSPY